MTSGISHPKDRLEYLDVAKGIGILLVVIGHHLDGFPGLTVWIYSFHMPLFFVISGWLYAYKRPNITLRAMIKNKVQRLLYPYCVFSVLVILWRVLLFLLLDSVPDKSFSKILWKTITTYGYHAMWFLPALFLAELIVHLIESKCTIKKVKAIVYGMTVLLAFLILEYRSFFSLCTPIEFFLLYIARVCVAVMFCKIGMLLYIWNDRISTKAKIGVLIISFAVSVFCAGYNGMVNIASGIVQSFPLLFLLGTCGSIAVILVSQILARNVFLLFWGKNSLFVMCTHMDFSIEIAYMFLAQLNLTYNFVNQSTLAVIIELILLGVAIPIVNKYFGGLLYPYHICKNRRAS